MADVRALLKAKRQEARITHPYAAYSANGALRCTACGATVKFASAWEGHLGSKAHRVAVAKLRAQEDAATLRREVEKLGADGRDELDMIMETEPQPQQPPMKRQRTEEREQDPHASRPAFPADFFSDPSRAPLLLQRGDDDEDEDDDDHDHDHDMDEDGRDSAEPRRRRRRPAPAPAPAPETKPSQSQFDAEWAAFEQDMQSLPPPPTANALGGNSEAAPDPQEMYARATIAAEPELVPQFEGLPQARAGGGGTGTGALGAVVAEVGQGQGHKVSEEEERKQRQMEEHELIMDRLLEEERAQEEADSRVTVLKNRVEMLKKKRELAGKARGEKTDAAWT
jgi:zinc finger protein 830